jgi:asparagine synthase (glutamine-hydrolysing)
MCGLIGSSAKLQINLDSIAHRGPDAAAEIVAGYWRLGHTRLAIQDLTDSSNQPVTSNGTVITYNGELWNPEQLRSQLPGQWATTGDTEVVARALGIYGEDALAMFDGMFALAWVQADGILRLARDPYGEVPLHYGLTEDRQFVYCSEITPMLTMGVDPSTIRWVQPGHIVTVTAEGSIESRRWYIEPEDNPNNSVRQLLKTGVRNRLIGDTPMAYLLSGGLDSSAVAALGKPNGAVAYTAVHYTKSRDRRCAHEIAERLGMILIEVPIPVPTADDMKNVIRYIEQPHKAQIEISWACIHLAKRLQADGIKIVLSGEGSDELLGSYGMAYHGIKQHGFRGYREKIFVGQHRKNFARTNKVFMRFGIEARLPFLHPPLVTHLLARSQDEVTMNKRHPKAILASAVEDLIGTSVAWRPKAAFQTDARIDQSAARTISDPAKLYKQTFATEFAGVKP